MEDMIAEVDETLDVLRNELDAVTANQEAGRQFLIRSLSLQHRLAKGERRRFLAMAAYFELLGSYELRNLLHRWAVEVELHDDVARFELQEMDEKPHDCPLDAKLWGAYFDGIVLQRPFVTLGATYALACLQCEAAASGRRLASEEALPHESECNGQRSAEAAGSLRGSQIVEALQSDQPDHDELADIAEGVRTGTILGLRMARWAMGHAETALGVAV